VREIEQRLGFATRLAAHIADPREPTQVVDPIADGLPPEVVPSRWTVWRLG
jgi:hypothetical protein